MLQREISTLRLRTAVAAVAVVGALSCTAVHTPAVEQGDGGHPAKSSFQQPMPSDAAVSADSAPRAPEQRDAQTTPALDAGSRVDAATTSVTDAGHAAIDAAIPDAECPLDPWPPCAKQDDDCDGRDDDCDGQIDEDVDLKTDALHCGACDQPCALPHAVKPGCVAGRCVIATDGCEAGFADLDGSAATGCEYRCPVFPPLDEACNGTDDDCDGQADENVASCPSGLAPSGPACGQGGGECRPGVLTTDPGSGAMLCVGAIVPTDEICDGLDNDCDLWVDEGLDPGAACGSDVGLCTTGVLACLNGQAVCAGETRPAPERCDCEDNDCDGKVDEDSTSDPLCGQGALCVQCACSVVCWDATSCGAQCPPGTVPKAGAAGCHCASSPCSDAACASETITHGGKLACAPSDPSVATCVCRGTTCAARCDDVRCLSNEACDPRDGRCKVKNCLLPELACAPGHTCALANGVWFCAAEACSVTTCASDQACRNGTCIASCADVVCAARQRCLDGSCVADLCATVSCDADQVCNPADGSCAPVGACFHTGCAPSTVCNVVSGACEPDPCLELHCPAGQTCAAGQCRH